MKLNKIVAGVMSAMLLAAPMSAAAYESVSTDNLTEVQQKEIAAQVANLEAVNAKNKTAGVSAPGKTVERVNEWVQVGAGIGDGIATTAQKLGVVANQFVNTPVGKMTMFLIFFKIMGSTVIHVSLGIVWFLTTTPLWIYFYQKLWQPAEVKYEYNDKGKKTSKTVVRQNFSQYDNTQLNNAKIWGIVIGALIAAAGVIITIT